MSDYYKILRKKKFCNEMNSAPVPRSAPVP